MEELEAFQRDYISLKDYARSVGCSSKAMKMKLDANGIEPIGDHYGVGRFYYRRGRPGYLNTVSVVL